MNKKQLKQKILQSLDKNNQFKKEYVYFKKQKIICGFFLIISIIVLMTEYILIKFKLIEKLSLTLMIVLFFVCSISSLSIVIFYFSYLKLKKTANSLNKILHSTHFLESIYKDFYESQKDLKNLSDFKLNVFSYYPEIKTITQYYKKELKTDDFPNLKQDSNYLEFKINNKYAKFIINDPKLYAGQNINNKVREFNRRGSGIFLSEDFIFLEHEKICQSCCNLRIKKAHQLKGEYKTESVEFNNKYSTNISLNDINGVKFLSPSAIDNLNKLEDKNFVTLGIDKYIFVKKCYINKEIFPLANFDFLKHFLKHDLVDRIVNKMFLELELFKRSISYISFIK